MKLFIIGLLILLGGYAVYGRFVEKALSPDDRETPAVSLRDGVDFMVLPPWKNMLIQLLNIAGIGPVIGVILGIKFGVIAFVIIPVGNIIGGAVHDFLSGMEAVDAIAAVETGRRGMHQDVPVENVVILDAVEE